MTAVADCPGARVDFTQDVLNDGLITFQSDVLLAVRFADQLIGKSKFLGKQIHDGVIGLGFP